MAGKSFLRLGQAGIGTQTTTERNAGVGTATGTTTFDVTDSNAYVYSGDEWLKMTESFSATGGTEITDSNVKYHVFTAPGDFEVSGTATIDFLLVAGGGSMMGSYGSGGGGGGISHGQSWPVTAGTYPIVVGAGGTYGTSTQNDANAATAHGNDSTFNGVTSVGGGIGMHDGFEPTPSPYSPFMNGGSGGGSGDDAAAGAGTGTQPAQPTHSGLVTNYGRPGFAPELGNGPGPGNQNCGGGGASQGGGPEGTAGSSVTGQQRSGGAGQAFPAFPAPVLAPAIPAPVRPTWTPAVGPTGLFGGGGGGAGNTPGPYAGGPGGGGAGTTSANSPSTPGVDFTGGGGGAVYTGGTAGDGGDGICIIRYTT